jgi:hypothetical protein
MKSITVILFIALASVLCYVFFASRGTSQKDKDNAYQISLDSLVKVYKDSLHKQELKALEVFQEYITKLNKMEGDRNHWKSKYNHEKNRNRNFSDSELDSLILAIK